ncbi:DUF6160 family protein [Hahella sp. SMD15-11]|uniref:DUF6160 family protein n=1 Tax=Thermohahella caldifontis TaxID=3142973 RepID=A0AB39UZ56_9GAMM
MKGLKKLVLVTAIAAAPLAANAELKAVDDATLEAATGQSGLLVEVALGTTTGDALNRDYTNAGVTIEAFKWTVDLETYDSATNVVTLGTGAPAGLTSGQPVGGFVATDIAIAGNVDVAIDGAVDGSGHGGIAMVLNTGAAGLDFKVGDMGVFGNAGSGNVQASSMGGIEMAGIHLKDVSMVISGR